ncbi:MULTISPECIES: phosphonate C-P lyase system protein PhnH [unclassified Bosea (in: a-proteobacteria)]|uniref:phosphonate C-P lyase system protein PhnH n=1 Tax=unclassified Bosea (in: a-proteobacteria) TaxID=2653178 RepID=UPI000F755B12|nr:MULTISPECIES: phosphonate C-P lyase system protein PhnH [unclassified Bosea (in: a-proteobacteria)]AZO80041.1 phosphonate C-P lyase system protein PhnH [Bosea sp. Tri-49]RXT22824.1 phosphonate C-P lyase system protein PhnH [Bosea sp. Tri-39]RXT38293.1 phosphonate C-P lyase system protein PhnH [Bosea sp. Tri-54]
MTPNDTLIGAGFADPVFQSQGAFRALLAALSEPGLACDIGVSVETPAGLELATAVALLTLADYETPIWLPAALRDGAAGAWLRFHCGAALVDDPARAAFAVIDGAAAEPKLAAFNAGDDQFPDRSTTVLIQCAGLASGDTVTLEGPGIAGRRTIAPAGLRPGFWAEVADNAVLYPLGVDLLLVHGTQALGLPRSTQIAEAR